MSTLSHADLILNEDGSIYHLGLRPEHIADTIILVGDPQRVKKVAQHFDAIEFQQQRREFVTTTGRIGNRRLTVLATGIGVDNIDIVFNELDALVNVDLETRRIKEKHTALTFIRLGTSGSIRTDLPVGSFLVADYSIGLEGLLLFYKQQLSAQEQGLKNAFDLYLKDIDFHFPITPTYCQATSHLIQQFQAPIWKHGIGMTATGFYAPQNRKIRAQSVVADLFSKVEAFEYDQLNVTNLEMETSGIYGLANILGHHAIALNAILANRPTGKFSDQPKALERQLIQAFFDTIL